jgi:AcrR family transcriptional regulator
MPYDNTTSLRHAPKQVRGQRKVDYIVRSAEALFAEIGYENATTNAIAMRANVSIGSLYQFFSSKEAILETMANRYLNQTREALDKVLSPAEQVPLEDLLTNLLDSVLKLQEQRPYFLQCLSSSRLTPVLCTSVTRLNEEMAEQVVRLLERSSPERDAVVLRLRARICVETLGALLPLAVRVRGRERSLAIGEIKQVLIRYLEPTLTIRGIV